MFFAYSKITTIFTGLTHFSPVICFPHKLNSINNLNFGNDLNFFFIAPPTQLCIALCLTLVLFYLHVYSFFLYILGEWHCVPSCPRYLGHCRFRWALQFLGQGCSYKAKDVWTVWSTPHSLYLQSTGEHLCLCYKLRLVKGNNR